VLSEKARRGNLVCIDSMDTLNGKTRSMVSLLQKLGISSSALVVTNGPDTNLILAAHNLKGVWTMPINLLNANDLLRRETLIMTLDAVRQAEEIWTGRVYRGPSHRPWANATPEPAGDYPAAPAPRRRRRAAATEAEAAK
jgi:hypothetical protein